MIFDPMMLSFRASEFSEYKDSDEDIKILSEILNEFFDDMPVDFISYGGLWIKVKLDKLKANWSEDSLFIDFNKDISYAINENEGISLILGGTNCLTIVGHTYDEDKS